MPAETFQNKYNMVFHENANCTVMNDVQFHQPVTIVSGDKTFLNETQMPSNAPAEVEDELLAILQDQKLYEETVKWAATCRKPKDLQNRVCHTLKQNGFRRFNKDFVEALIPHLTNYECDKTDYRNIQRVFY